MELVYLWVEDYKNIKNQGFNFSPRFICDYDVASNELTINENEDYIENFFGDNINVTAIVGKNGSGKSNVFEVLMKIAHKHSLLDSTCFFMYKKDDTFNLTGNLVPKIIPSDYASSDDAININWINYKYTRTDDLQLTKYIRRQSPFNEYGSNIIFKHVHVYNNYPNIIKIIKEKYLFDTFQLEIGLKSEEVINEKNLDGEYILSGEERGKCGNIINNLYGKKTDQIANRWSLSIKNRLIRNSFLFYIHFVINNCYFSQNGNLNGYFRDSLKELDKLTNMKTVFRILNKFKGLLKENEESGYLYGLFDKNFKELLFLKSNLNKFFLEKKEYIWRVNLTETEDIKNIIFNTQTISGISSIEDMYLGDCIFYNFINKKTNVSYNGLSDGEKEVLKVSVDLIHHLDINRDGNSLFLLDEVDNSLHPMWKKEILKIKVDILQKFIMLHENTNIHLLFVTHSPFLLSDMPKQNIIFLDKDENGNCKVVDGLIEKKQTFGANIHTLLSDSFFMDDGLMGEFAKSKIDQAIMYLNQEKLSTKELKYCEEIISIIGEPIVKNQLQRMLDSKRLKKVDEIDAIKTSMEKMQERLDELEK